MVKYVPADDPALLRALEGFDQGGDDEVLELRGPCPRCGHDFVAMLPLKPAAVVLGRGLTGQSSGRDLTQDPTEHLVVCSCASEHDGRPEDAVGCGAMTKLRIRPLGDARP